MQENEYPIERNEIVTYVLDNFSTPNKIQIEVLGNVVTFSFDRNAAFTNDSLSYLFNEIEGPSAIEGLQTEPVIRTLNTMLLRFWENREDQNIISSESIENTFLSWSCPKPWC